MHVHLRLKQSVVNAVQVNMFSVLQQSGMGLGGLSQPKCRLEAMRGLLSAKSRWWLFNMASVCSPASLPRFLSCFQSLIHLAWYSLHCRVSADYSLPHHISENLFNEVMAPLTFCMPKTSSASELWCFLLVWQASNKGHR